jgi:hypothetical protein
MLRAHGSQITADILRDAIAVLSSLGDVASVLDLADALPQHRGYTLMIACLLDWDGHIRLDRREFFTADIQFENYLSSSPDGGEAAAP